MSEQEPDLDLIEKRMQRFYAHGLVCNEDEQRELLAVFRELRQKRAALAEKK